MPQVIKSMRVWRIRESEPARPRVVLRLETQEGLKGFGECPALGAGEAAAVRKAVEGLDCTAVETARQRLAATPAAQAAVNMAMLDLAGKAVQAPVYQLLGGPTRGKVRVMTSLAGDSNQRLAESLAAARAAGHRAVAVPLPALEWRNHGEAFVKAVVTRLEALRKAVNEEVDFVLDAAGALTPGDAASLSAALERFHLLWLDEPCQSASGGAFRKLAGERVTPIGTGRKITSAAEFQDLLREDAIDVLRPAIGLNGITAIRKMAALAETYYVAVAPYHDGGPIATAAALHLAASLPNFYIQQIPGNLEGVVEGYAALPRGPGLGIAVDERELDRSQERAS